MSNKKKLENHKIEYGGKKFNIDLYGAEDYETQGGLWDLAKACADNVVGTLDGCMFFDTDEQSDLVHQTVRDAVYSLIKFRMLRPLDQQLKHQKEM